MAITVVSLDGITLPSAIQDKGVWLGQSLPKNTKQRAVQIADTTYIIKRFGRNIAVLVTGGWTYTLIGPETIWISSPFAGYLFRHPTSAEGVLETQGIFVLLDPTLESGSNGVLDDAPGVFSGGVAPHSIGVSEDYSFGRYAPGTTVGAPEQPPTEVLFPFTSYVLPSVTSGVTTIASYIPLHTFDLNVNATVRDVHSYDVTAVPAHGTVSFVLTRTLTLLVGRESIELVTAVSTSIDNYPFSPVETGETAQLAYFAATSRGGYAFTFACQDIGLVTAYAKVLIVEKNAAGMWEIVFSHTTDGSESSGVWYSPYVIPSFDPTVAGVFFSYVAGAPVFKAITYVDGDTLACTLVDQPQLEGELRDCWDTVSPGYFDSYPAYVARRTAFYNGHIPWLQKVYAAETSPYIFAWELCAAGDADAEYFDLQKLGINHARRGTTIIPSQWADNTGVHENLRTVGTARWAFATYAKYLIQ